jgi:methionyl-tRNA formyltransferase
MSLNLKILFIGTVKFSESALKKLIDMKANVIGVITKKESKFNADFVDLSHLAKVHNIPYIHVKSANSPESIEFIKNLAPDIIYCFGWSEILKEDVLNLPKLGVVGFHPAKLPQNRGRHPIVWALFLGLEETASTFFFMDKGVDSGDIISQEIIKIEYEDDASTLYEKITQTALRQIETFTLELEEGKMKRIPQDFKESNSWRKRNELDGLIDFRMSSRAVYNLVRALTRPYVGADIIYKGKKYKVWKAKEEIVKLLNIEPGKVLKIKDNQIFVKCYENAIWLVEHELEELPKEGDYLL